MSEATLHAEVLAAVRQVRDEMIAVRAEMQENHKESRNDLGSHIVEEGDQIETMKVATQSMTRLMMEIQVTNSDNSRIAAETTVQLTKIAETLKSLDEKTTNIEGAFPNKDPKGHHDHHMLLITKAQRWASRVEKWKDDIGGWAVKAGLIFMLLALFEAVKGHFK